jgi:predicted nucleic acid-binding Zn ribbon protein
LNRSNEQTLRSAIEEFLKTFRLQDKLNETRVLQSWEKIVGPIVANHTLSLSIRKKVLFVKVDSAALRNELMFAREKIISALNTETGTLVIEDIVF